MHSDNDYISLDELKVFALHSYQLLLKTCGMIRRIAWKNKFLTLAGLLTGLVIAWLFYSSRYVTYTYAMSIETDDVPAVPSRLLLNELEDLPGLQEGGKLAGELNIPLDQAKKIISIQSKDISEKRDTSDRSKDKSHFSITVVVKDTLAKKALDDSIISYLNRGPYIRRIAIERRVNAREKLVLIDKGLAELDSIKHSAGLSMKPPVSGSPVLNRFADLSGIYKQSLEFEEERTELSNLLKNNASPVLLLIGFKMSSFSAPNLIKFLLSGALAGLMAALAIAFFWELNKKVNTARRV